MLSTKIITDKATWENYISVRSEANFLQSWNWGEFQNLLGKKIIRLFFYSNSTISGCCLAYVENSKRGSYLTIAGGPLIDWNSKKIIVFFTKEIKKIASKNNCSFVRLRPQIKDDLRLRQRLAKLGYLLSFMHLTADLTLELDICDKSENILSQMRKTTRYEIRKAQKMGIEIRFSKDLDEMRNFYRQQLVLAKKQHFIPFSYPFLKNQFAVFSREDQCLLVSSYLDNRLLASAFIIFYNQEAVYHYGISTSSNSKLPGAYACLWAAILKAKERGLKRFNFWGVAPSEQTDHRFYRLSVFKRGFGGSEIQYLPTHDLPIAKFYYLVRFFEFFRKKNRHL